MTRQELTALRDAIDMTLALPDSIRALLAQWLAPETAKPNGHDPHPPRFQAVAASDSRSRITAPLSRPTQAGQNRSNSRPAELRLLAAMRGKPGSSMNALAKAAGANRASTGERLRRLAAQGEVEKDPDGRWKLKREDPRPTAPREEPGPTIASPS
jgi:hypothetical protein